MAKVQRKQRTCRLRGNMSCKLATTVTAVHKCTYPGTQWTSLVWDPQREQVIIVLLKQSPFWYVTGEGEPWAERGAQGEEGRGRQDQLVVLKVETSKLYRLSEPTSNKLVRTCFVLRDFCYSRQGLPFNSRLLQISSITYMSFINTSILLWFDKLCKCTDLDKRDEMPNRFLSYNMILLS